VPVRRHRDGPRIDPVRRRGRPQQGDVKRAAQRLGNVVEDGWRHRGEQIAEGGEGEPGFGLGRARQQDVEAPRRGLGDGPAHEGGLADPGRTDQQQRRGPPGRRVQHRLELPDLLISTEERLDVGTSILIGAPF
jgi:hypothetical protein